MNYIGIDPGKMGSIVIINQEGKIIEKHKMPLIARHLKDYDIYGIYNILRPHASGAIAGLERAQVFPISGKRACFSNGYGFAVMETCLRILNISYILIPPLVWMRAMLVGIGHKKEKGSIAWAITNYPHEDWRATPNSQHPDDGHTDACAIANYTKLVHQGGIKNVENTVSAVTYTNNRNGNAQQNNNPGQML